jgi:hypothetical protein
MEEEKEKIVFVTEDTSLHRKAKIDRTDLEIIQSAATGEGLIPIDSMEQLMELAKALSDTFDYFREHVGSRMTKEQAEFIRKLRVEKDYSWRAVARACWWQKWEGYEEWQPASSQPMGMALCEKAAEFFGEHYRAKPWN